MKKLIFYWGPFIDRGVATKKAIFNSAKAVNHYSKKYTAKIINAIGEWSKEDLENNEDLFLNFNHKIYMFLPKYSYFKSRLSFIIIFLTSWFSLKKNIINHKPSFIIIHLIVSLPMLLFYFNNFSTKLILRISGKPKINAIRLFIWKLTSKRVYKVFCPTNETKNLLIKLKIFDPKIIFVLTDPVFQMESLIKKRKETIEEKKFEKGNFILIGRLTKQKNFDLIIKAYAKLNQEMNIFKIFILGEGELYKKLQENINKYKLQHKIFLLGKVKNVYSYLSQSKAFILTSLWEDPGFVIVEAALNNTPIIASNCKSGPAEILENGKGGFLFENNNVEALIKSIKAFLNEDRKNIIKMTITVKKKIKKYSFFSHYRNLIKLLDETIS